MGAFDPRLIFPKEKEGHFHIMTGFKGHKPRNSFRAQYVLDIPRLKNKTIKIIAELQLHCKATDLVDTTVLVSFLNIMFMFQT